STAAPAVRPAVPRTFSMPSVIVSRTMGAKSLTDVAGLQAAFLQTRVETSAAHSKEFVDVAREQAEATLKPVIELLDGKRAA
ncbi:MAG: phasin family protein, partial [Pseudomonadota bacterium]